MKPSGSSVVGVGAIGPSSSSADSSSRAVTVKSLSRLEEENPLGESMWGGPSFSMFNGGGSSVTLRLEDCSDGVQQMGSSSHDPSSIVDDPGRIYQKPTADDEVDNENELSLLSLVDSDDSEMDLSR